MAAGKSTVGFIVANTIGYSFVDLDREIERRDGRSIPDIFSAEGEAYFRRLEAEALRHAGGLRDVVVSLGGGALTTDAAWESIAEGSVVVYLDTPSHVLARRIYYGRSVRPLMLRPDGQKLSLPEVEGKVRAMLEKRIDHYRRADVVIESGNRSVGRTVDMLVAALRQYESDGLTRPR